jgi:hypothetical protein
MKTEDSIHNTLRGQYRDRIHDSNGGLVFDSGWKNNAIVNDCRRLLAGFMRGAPATAGIVGLAVGEGLAAWDTALPPPNPAKLALENQLHLEPAASLSMDFIAGGAVTGLPTNRLQIVANLGPGTPAGSPTLREFGLVSSLDGSSILVNYVMHPAIVKDVTSTLERTIWLVF